jgi:hypothetical protein
LSWVLKKRQAERTKYPSASAKPGAENRR